MHFVPLRHHQCLGKSYNKLRGSRVSCQNAPSSFQFQEPRSHGKGSALWYADSRSRSPARVSPVYRVAWLLGPTCCWRSCWSKEPLQDLEEMSSCEAHWPAPYLGMTDLWDVGFRNSWFQGQVAHPRIWCSRLRPRWCQTCVFVFCGSFRCQTSFHSWGLMSSSFLYLKIRKNMHRLIRKLIFDWSNKSNTVSSFLRDGHTGQYWNCGIILVSSVASVA